MEQPQRVETLKVKMNDILLMELSHHSQFVGKATVSGVKIIFVCILLGEYVVDIFTLNTMRNQMGLFDLNEQKRHYVIVWE